MIFKLTSPFLHFQMMLNVLILSLFHLASLIWGPAEGRYARQVGNGNNGRNADYLSCTILTMDLESLLSSVQGLASDIEQQTADYNKIVSFSQTSIQNGLEVVLSDRTMSFKNGFEFCSNRNARLIEPTPGNIKTIQGIINEKIWIDVYTPTRSENLYYRSLVPLATNLGNGEGTVPKTLASTKCLMYDPATYHFATVECTAEYKVLCQAIKSHEQEVNDKILVHELSTDLNLQGTANFLQNGQHHLKQALLDIYPQSNALCTSATRAQPLSTYLGFDQPLRRLNGMSRAAKLHYVLSANDFLQHDLRRLDQIRRNVTSLVTQILEVNSNFVYQGYDGNGRICVCPSSLARLTTTTTIRPPRTTTTEQPSVDLTTWGTFDLSELCFVLLALITTVVSCATAVVQILQAYKRRDVTIAHVVDEPRHAGPSAPPRYHLATSCTRGTSSRSSGRSRDKSPSVRLIDGATFRHLFEVQTRPDRGDRPVLL